MKRLMLGNEAVARGAYEAGVTVISSYPGTPSTEITEYASQYEDIKCEWAPNEKVATEVAFGAAIAGARSLTAMKHVGVNVAADPIFTAAYSGINAGMVIVCADDPGMHSSQNEQDSRYYARAAQIPMLEPADSQECKDFTKIAFEISESYDIPVFVRLTTRVSHSRTIVKLDEKENIPLKNYEKNPSKYVMMPGMARKRRAIMKENENKLLEYANYIHINKIEKRSEKLGVICSGIVYQYVREAFPDASILKLGLVNPLPFKKIKDFSKSVDRLIVIEELEGIIEEQIAAMGISVEGKEHTGYQGELSTHTIKEIFESEKKLGKLKEEVIQRPPVLCPGCPHRGTFYALKKLNYNIFGDIGCYTMAALPPLNAMDTCLCMGASISMALGAEKARGKEFSRKSIAVIGDSTFLHSGITGLIDAIYSQSTITVLILDNRTTGMTGHQENPTSGKNIYGEKAPEIDLEKLCYALGVKNVKVVDPFEQKSFIKTVKEEVLKEAVSVIIVERPCELIIKVKKTPKEVIDCKNCGICLEIGCPCIIKTDTGVTIDSNICVGCELCANVCPFDAIHPQKRTIKA